MSNNVHHQRKVPSHLLIYIMWSRPFQCPRAKYLGITLTDELSWSSHVRSIHNRANSTIGLLRRNLRRCPATARVKETAYTVRSTLEYAAPVWDPHLARDCDILEKDTAAISEVCQRGLKDDIQCDPDAAWSRLARSEWSSARPQTGFIVQGRHWTCGRWSWPDWLSGCGKQNLRLIIGLNLGQ